VRFPGYLRWPIPNEVRRFPIPFAVAHRFEWFNQTRGDAYFEQLYRKNSLRFGWNEWLDLFLPISHNFREDCAESFFVKEHLPAVLTSKLPNF